MVFRDTMPDGTVRLTGDAVRLAAVGSSAGELAYNAKVDSGWYVMSSVATNAPVAATCYLEVRNYAGTYIEQTARHVTLGDEYRRYMVGGVWYNWVKASANSRDITAAAAVEHVNLFTGATHMVRRSNVVDIYFDVTCPAGGMGGGAAAVFIPPEHRPVMPYNRYLYGVDGATGSAVLVFYNATNGYICHTFARSAGQSTYAIFTWLAPD